MTYWLILLPILGHPHQDRADWLRSHRECVAEARVYRLQPSACLRTFAPPETGE